MDITAQASRIGALADETRRALYEHVVTQPDAVTREGAAAAIGIPAHMARFHLDKLVDAGLLETEFRRLSGRTGPGAGRPAKLYRRAPGTVSVSLPERRYDLVARVLAEAIERADGAESLRGAVREAAHDEGRMLAASTPSGARAEDDGSRVVTDPGRDRLRAVLAAHGYEPRPEGEATVLGNCPFDSLAREHTQLICSANVALLGGVLDGLHREDLRACLEPHVGRCCVAIRPRD